MRGRRRRRRRRRMKRGEYDKQTKGEESNKRVREKQ